MPGEDFAESLRLVLDELPDLPHLPELPARGAVAEPDRPHARRSSASSASTCSPPGWRLTDAPGVDHRTGAFAAGPGPRHVRGADPGLRGPAQGPAHRPLDAGLHRREAPRRQGARRLRRPSRARPGARGGSAHPPRRRTPARAGRRAAAPGRRARTAGRDGRSGPDASGFSRHRSVTPPVASEALEWVFAAAGDVPVVAHCCAAEPPIALLRGAGAGGVSLDLAVLAARAYDDLATVARRGRPGPPGRGRPRPASSAPSTKSAVERVQRLLDMLGLRPGGGGRPAGADSRLRAGRRDVRRTPAQVLGSLQRGRRRARLTACPGTSSGTATSTRARGVT